MKTKALATALVLASISHNVSAVDSCIGSPTIRPTTVVNSTSIINVINGDMSGLGDALPHGVPSWWSWAKGPLVYKPLPPAGWSAMTAWGQVYRDITDSGDTNTRIQIRNMKNYVLSKSTGKWTLVQSTVGVTGGHYIENFAGNAAIAQNIRMITDGSIAAKLPHRYNYHFWPNAARPYINASDIAGIFITVQARLIVDDPTRPDDRYYAKYLINVGADWWLSTTAPYQNQTTNTPAAIGRFKVVTNNWQTYNATTLSAAQILANPPPLEQPTGLLFQ